MLIIGFAGLSVLAFVPKKYLWHFSLTVSVLIASLSGYWAGKVLLGREIGLVVGPQTLLGPLTFCLDGLSAWFVLIVDLLMVLAIFNSRAYLQQNGSSASNRLHYLCLVILHQSLIWVCTVQNGFAFLFAWEIMSLSSALLLLQGFITPKSLSQIVSYLVQTHLSGIVLAVAFVWMVVSTGKIGFDGLSPFLNSGVGIWPFVLFFVGFGLKAEFVPLHGKVPRAYSSAMPHVASILSGVMVKMGIFGILRMVTYLHTDFVLIGEIILTTSLVTALYGVMNAAVHRNIFRMLAYCTIENVGVIGIGIGLGVIGLGVQMPVLVFLGFGGALLQSLNHSLGKSLLFYSSGWIIAQTHTKDMDKMGGLVKTMPQTGWLFLLGALSISGLPPFNGFVSEFMLYLGLINGLSVDKIELASLMALSIGSLAIVGGLALLLFTKVFGVVFLGQWRSAVHINLKDLAPRQLASQLLLLLVMVSVVLFPGCYLNLLQPALQTVGLDNALSFSVVRGGAFDTLNGINLIMLGLLAIVLLVWMVRKTFTSAQNHQTQPTWGCGNTFPTRRIQYTGKSFSKPLGKIFGFLLMEQKCYHEIRKSDIFPSARKYVSHYHDFVETKLLDNLLQRLVYGANYFKFIQNGRVQSYVLYGIVYILAIFVLTIFNILP